MRDHATTSSRVLRPHLGEHRFPSRHLQRFGPGRRRSPLLGQAQETLRREAPSNGQSATGLRILAATLLLVRENLQGLNVTQAREVALEVLVPLLPDAALVGPDAAGGRVAVSLEQLTHLHRIILDSRRAGSLQHPAWGARCVWWRGQTAPGQTPGEVAGTHAAECGSSDAESSLHRWPTANVTQAIK